MNWPSLITVLTGFSQQDPWAAVLWSECEQTFRFQGVVSLTFRELSKIISQKYATPEITFMIRISSWNLVGVPKAWLWAHVQSFSLKFWSQALFLQYTNFERIFWRARKTLVKQPPGPCHDPTIRIYANEQGIMENTVSHSYLHSLYKELILIQEAWLWALKQMDIHCGNSVILMMMCFVDWQISHIRHQAIIQTNAGSLSIGILGINFSEILIKLQNFSFTKMHLNISFAKWWPFCPGGDELINADSPCLYSLISGSGCFQRQHCFVDQSSTSLHQTRAVWESSRGLWLGTAGEFKHFDILGKPFTQD